MSHLLHQLHQIERPHLETSLATVGEELPTQLGRAPGPDHNGFHAFARRRDR